MCGLVGYFGPGLTAPRATLTRAAETILHRGPDAGGFWSDPAAPLHLAFRRLAIQDLTPAGSQPMVAPDGGLVIAFNGEIYNHLELRLALEKEAAAPAAWRGHSDTETLLACFQAWGVRRTLEAAIGMFAIALWDRGNRRLVLARDRLGEKPLYFGYVGAGIGFASELKALRTLPGFDTTIDPVALGGLVSGGATPDTRSIYRGISKLAPGTWLELTPADLAARQTPPVHAYWRLSEVARHGLEHPLRFGSDEEATDALENVLGSAVQSQLISDVPLGAFLSGGIDSSTIVALMQARSSQPVRTFSIGFHEHAYNEADHAKAVATHLGTDHHELYVDDVTARDVVTDLPGMYCEPFGDFSQIPTFLVSRMAREHVTVSLSGDAGDEMFGGYSRYFMALRAWNHVGRVPGAVRRSLARVIQSVSPGGWGMLIDGPGRILPARVRSGLSGHRILRGSDLIGCRNFQEFYARGFMEFWSPDLVKGVTRTAPPHAAEAPSGLSHLGWMMYTDAMSYLPDDILVKVDRAAMAISLETRVPILDKRVVEFAWHLPDAYRLRDGAGKWLLRQVLYRHVPRALVDRPKMGFGVPLDSWLRGPLRGWAEDLLSSRKLLDSGVFSVAPIRQRWAEHLSGARNWQFYLWPVLMYQAWREAQTA